MRYFTSDFHFGSANINKYAHRPFDSAETAARQLIYNVNTTCQSSDFLIHVGDFMLSGKDRHGNVDDNGLKFTCEHYLNILKPNVFLLNGNHDNGHNCEAAANSMIVDLNQNYRNVYVSHYPSTNHFYKGPRWIHTGNKYGIGIVLCGHVHDSWLVQFDYELNTLNINVGVDVWNYKPVRDAQLTKLIDDVMSYGLTKLYSMPRMACTREEHEKLLLQVKEGNMHLREARRQERYAKKGLTPEECQRRKEAAMKAKGLK